MNPTDCLVFLATTCVLFAISCAHVLSNTIYEPIQGTLFIRSKRDDARAMTMSGYFPNAGMSAFATSGDWRQWNRGRGNRRPMIFPEQEWNNSQNVPQAQEEITPESGESSWKEENQPSQPVNKDELKPSSGKKPKKKPSHHKDKSSEEDEDEPISHGHSGGNAAASFNAWFPIMLGMFPPSQENVDGYSSSSRKATPHTTIVANSVSHGPGGVASSHAVAYGTQPDFRSQHH